jgi:hypothetical protein
MEMYMGRTVLDNMYDKLLVQPKVTKLFLSFPERWLNIIEQRQIYRRCQEYLPNLEELTLKTHSVFITQCTPHGSLYVMDTSDKELKETDVSVLHHNNTELGFINPNKLTVLHVE